METAFIPSCAALEAIVMAFQVIGVASLCLTRLMPGTAWAVQGRRAFVFSLMGLGGAIVLIPALVYLFGMTQHQAQGTSLATLLLPMSPADLGALEAASDEYGRFVGLPADLVIKTS